MFKKIFQELGLSESTQMVFDILLKNGPISARIISEKLGIPRTSVYDHLKILINKGLVTERGGDGKKVFMIDKLENVEELLSDKIKQLQREKEEFKNVLPSFWEKAVFVEPQIKFYSGAEGVKQIMNQVLLNRNIGTELFWPMSEMMKVLGPEYLEDLNQKRVQKNIFLRAIWPSDQILDTEKYPYLKSSEETLRDLRIAPENMKWQMGYWIYENKVAFLSSEKEGFGFVVNSKEFAELMRLQFEEIWKISKFV